MHARQCEAACVRGLLMCRPDALITTVKLLSYVMQVRHGRHGWCVQARGRVVASHVQRVERRLSQGITSPALRSTSARSDFGVSRGLSLQVDHMCANVCEKAPGEINHPSDQIVPAFQQSTIERWTAAIAAINKTDQVLFNNCGIGCSPSEGVDSRDPRPWGEVRRRLSLFFLKVLFRGTFLCETRSFAKTGSGRPEGNLQNRTLYGRVSRSGAVRMRTRGAAPEISTCSPGERISRR